MSGKNVRNLAHPRPARVAAGWATAALTAAGLVAALLLIVGISGLTGCMSGPASRPASAGPFVQGGYSPPPAVTPRPIGPAPAPEK
jgi:hypothetical protein